MAAPWRAARLVALNALDRWAWDREVAQHDPKLSPHQIREAAAWGAGARAALGWSDVFWIYPYPHRFPLA